MARALLATHYFFTPSSLLWEGKREGKGEGGRKKEKPEGKTIE